MFHPSRLLLLCLIGCPGCISIQVQAPVAPPQVTIASAQTLQLVKEGIWHPTYQWGTYRITDVDNGWRTQTSGTLLKLFDTPGSGLRVTQKFSFTLSDAAETIQVAANFSSRRREDDSAIHFTPVADSQGHDAPDPYGDRCEGHLYQGASTNSWHFDLRRTVSHGNYSSGTLLNEQGAADLALELFTADASDFTAMRQVTFRQGKQIIAQLNLYDDNPPLTLQQDLPAATRRQVVAMAFLMVSFAQFQESVTEALDHPSTPTK